ncbi:MAG: bifunctional glutamate N-acetyltransferase/amino-acid acetyltransferase ArgJ [Nitrospirales bacterium]|nr:bifunctional glutamate N-acetyltransferase/amino-acid acetyltransferase ArgJ [Nitrospirales bacterium]
MDILTPKGFLFSAVEAAIKKPGRKDLALIYSEQEAVMAGMFTTSKVKAAPVRLGMQRLRKGKGQAIVINSGNANACTGYQGLKDAKEMTDLVAEGLGISPQMVNVCSTGVIGTPMPMERVRQKSPLLVEEKGKATVHDLAAAIMTTDTFPKLMSRTIDVKGKEVTITAACKGAGMICPNMATMLCFIMTDAKIEATALKAALKDAVMKSFNRITVDGDMSTNDTVLAMANGMAGNTLITERSQTFKAFSQTIAEITYELGKMIVRDGEGATKVVDVEVKGAKTEKDAHKAAMTISNSLLVKTAIYGNDSNWGRIMGALGRAGISMKEEKVEISINGVKTVSKGLGTGRDEEANEAMKTTEIKLIVDLHLEKGSAKVLTCDLTEEYIKINAEYRT